MMNIKGLVHPKMKIKSLITHPMLYQPRKTFVHLRNTNEDIFLLNLRAVSLPHRLPKGLEKELLGIAPLKTGGLCYCPLQNSGKGVGVIRESSSV